MVWLESCKSSFLSQSITKSKQKQRDPTFQRLLPHGKLREYDHKMVILTWYPTCYHLSVHLAARLNPSSNISIDLNPCLCPYNGLLLLYHSIMVSAYSLFFQPSDQSHAHSFLWFLYAPGASWSNAARHPSMGEASCQSAWCGSGVFYKYLQALAETHTCKSTFSEQTDPVHSCSQRPSSLSQDQQNA